MSDEMLERGGFDDAPPPSIQELHRTVAQCEESKAAIAKLEAENDRFKTCLYLIAIHGGKTMTEEGMTCGGIWCGEQASRTLEGKEWQE